MEIQLSDLGKRFGANWLFKNIDYKFLNSQVYAVTGANGSGKSTLLKILAGLMKPNVGGINWVFENKSLENEIIFNYISFCAPYIKLPDSMNLEEVIKFHTSFKPFEKEMSIPSFAERIQLMKEIYNPLHQFSMGMMQRVKLGLALFSNSKIILLDEPTSNLDRAGKDWFYNILHQIKESKIVLIASNEEEEIRHSDCQLSISHYQ